MTKASPTQMRFYLQKQTLSEISFSKIHFKAPIQSFTQVNLNIIEITKLQRITDTYDEFYACKQVSKVRVCLQRAF